MVHKMIRFAILACCLPAVASQAHESDPQEVVQAEPLVAVPGGVVQGEARADKLIFRGIPFAAAPLGDRRWKAPQAVEPWQGVRDATKPAPACLQHLEGWNRANWLQASEDCLTLDVSTPGLSGKRPVMVWIHGGSNRAGSSAGPADSDLTAQGVVTVGIQYRLGVLGFLSHPGLTAEQGGASGNYGLMDQIYALQWVRDNIARFGGDPENITIFGESAGSQDVSLMLAAPAAQGLFGKAIMQSGTPGFGLPFRTLAEAEALGSQLDGLAGADGDLDRLRSLSPVALFALEAELSEPKSHGNSFIFLRTTIDGRVIPDAPDRLIANNAPKPVIIGTNKVEFGPADDDIDDLDAFAAGWYGSQGPEALAIYRQEQGRDVDPRRGSVALRMESDAVFHCPADRLADLMASHGWPVWRYEFDASEDGELTRHAYDVGFIFDRKPVGGEIAMQDYWAALAIAGDPNAPVGLNGKRPKWQRWKVGEPRQMAFGNAASGMEPGKPRAAVCRFTSHF